MVRVYSIIFIMAYAALTLEESYAVKEIKILWEFEADGNILSPPAIETNGVVYFGSYSGTFYALNPDGSKRFSIEGYEPFYSSPALTYDGTIIITSGNDDFDPYSGHIIGFRPSGRERFIIDANYNIYSQPAIAEDGGIYVSTYGGHIYKLNIEGDVHWSKFQGPSIFRPPILLDSNTVVFPSYIGLITLNSDGVERWRNGASGGLARSYLVADLEKNIYVPDVYGNLYAYSYSGGLKWVFRDDGQHVFGTPSLDSSSNIYFGDASGSIYSIDPSGVKNWQYSAEGEFIFSPIILNNEYILVVNTSGGIFFLMLQVSFSSIYNFLTLSFRIKIYQKTVYCIYL